MRPAESFLSQPIRNLQTMLRVIAIHRGDPDPLIPDGIYGSATMQRISAFQREHGIPATGTADLATWEAIVEAYRPARIHLLPAEPVHILMNPGEMPVSGKEDPNLYLIQAMLEVLCKRYGSIKSPGFSGILDKKTCESLESFQRLSGLTVTGFPDKITWKHLALQYPLASSWKPQEKR